MQKWGHCVRWLIGAGIVPTGGVAFTMCNWQANDAAQLAGMAVH